MINFFKISISIISSNNIIRLNKTKQLKNHLKVKLNYCILMTLSNLNRLDNLIEFPKSINLLMMMDKIKKEYMKI